MVFFIYRLILEKPNWIREVSSSMAVVSKNLNGYSIRQRIFVTTICLTLAITLVSSISIYVDSASVNEWSEQIKIGPVSMMVSGEGVKEALVGIAEISGVVNVSGLDSAHGQLSRRNVIYGFQTSGNVYTLTQDYMEKFPTTFTLTTGRWPTNESEIAISATLADQSFIGVSWQVNYSYGLGYPDILLTVVGTYTQSSGDLYSHYYYSSIGVVVESRLDVKSTATRVYLNIDKDPISPYDANGALRYLSGISDEIRNLYPGYPEEIAFSRFSVYDYLSIGIRSYLDWRNSVRSGQIVRASGVMLIVMFMVVLAIQYNLSERKNEASFLRARGASERRIELLVVRELLVISALSGVLGTFSGLLTSRIAIVSTGYLKFDAVPLFTSSILISQDTVLLILGVTFGLPSIVYLGIKFATSGKVRVSEGKGRLGKLSQGMKIVRWDMGILVISLALMFAFYTSESAIQRNAIYSLILPFLPIPIYGAVGSLVIKGLGRGTSAFSKLASKPLGKIPASIGVRRIAKSSRSAGLVIMVIVLAITLSWNNAVTEASLPETRENHAKFAIGGDLIFHLSKSHSDMWNEFEDNVTASNEVIASTTVSMRKLFLSSGYSGSIDFVIMQPDEYRLIGYDYMGNRLNESGLNDILLEMSENPSAAVLTKDLANEYQVEVGDTFRAFKAQADTDYFTFQIIAIVEALTHPLIPESTYIPSADGYAVGSRLIWINTLYAAEKLNLVLDTQSYLAVATTNECNTTQLALNLLDSGGDSLVYANDWASVDSEYESFVTATLYKMDRAVDSMLSIVSMSIVIGVMTVYATESRRERKRDIALLRSLGSDGKMIARIQFAELTFLIILSLSLLLLYGPLFIANSLIASLSIYTSWSFIFPVPMFIVIPWMTLLIILSFFVVCILVVIGIIALLSTKTELNEALSSYWTKGGPLVESENT
ncbi:MAG: ABC transporter permease [Candidatus Thorarchaeota archaeon]|nr:MAG: ABC transporter permease [Candidatus Thorarchaeota archaeon]